MQQASALTIVHAWQEAANPLAVERLPESSDPSIEIGGPRGSGHGYELLRDSVSRGGLRLQTRRLFVQGNAVVLAQHAVWRAAGTGEVTREASLASSFLVAGGRLAWVARYDTLDVALHAADLDYAAEVAR